MESNLPYEIKIIIIDEVKNWPKNLSSEGLLIRLDKFAVNIIETQKILDIAKELNIK